MKPLHILTWLIQLALAATLAMAGIDKLTADPDAVALFQKLHFDPGGRILIGVLEVAAAVLLVIPPSVLWGAVLTWGLMSGALIAHCSRLGFTKDFPMFGTLAVVLWLGSILVIFLRRHQSSSLSRMFAHRHASGSPADQADQP